MGENPQAEQWTRVLHSFMRQTLHATTPAGPRTLSMRSIAQCLAKAVELELSAVNSHPSVRAEYRHMATCWRGLARDAADAAGWTTTRPH